MSDISIKHNKHRAYPVNTDKKIQLLQYIIKENISKSIIIVSTEENSEIKEAINEENVKILDDKTLYKDKELKADLIISFDVPEKSIVYISRLSHSNDAAIVLLSKEQENLLYSVETLLGRAIKQEILAEFSDVTQLKTQLKTPKERQGIKRRKKEKTNSKKTGRVITIKGLDKQRKGKIELSKSL